MTAREENRQNLAAQGFLHLMDQLCMILLQDSVIMQEQFPKHPLWADPIFAREDYYDFVKEVKFSFTNMEEPQDIQLQYSVFVIAERLQVAHQSVMQSVIEWRTKNYEELCHLCTMLNDFFTGRATFTLQPTASSLGFPSASEAVPSSFCPISSLAMIMSASHNFVTDTPRSNGIPTILPPIYQLSRIIITVPDLWRE